MNNALTKNSACDLLDCEGSRVQSFLIAWQNTPALAELGFWVAERFNAAINLLFSSGTSALEVLSLGSLANRLEAAVSSLIFFFRLPGLPDHGANRKMPSPTFPYSIVNPP